MISQERRRALARNYRWIALGLWAVAGVLLLLAVLHATDPDADIVDGDYAEIQLAALTTLFTLGGLGFESKSRTWRRTVPVGTPPAVGQGTVVDIRHNRWGTKATVDVDHSGQWQFTTTGVSQDRLSQPGHRISIEWYSLDRNMAAAYQNHNTGRIRPVTTRRPR